MTTEYYGTILWIGTMFEKDYTEIYPGHCLHFDGSYSVKPGAESINHDELVDVGYAKANSIRETWLRFYSKHTKVEDPTLREQYQAHIDAFVPGDRIFRFRKEGWGIEGEDLVTLDSEKAIQFSMESPCREFIIYWEAVALGLGVKPVKHEEGTCPKCGHWGEAYAMAISCPTHGKFLG